MEFPAGLKYTKDHEWVDNGHGPTKIGVTAFAIDQLGDIVHVELPSVGESFEVGSPFGTIESTKTVSDLYMPIAGKIVEVNQNALDNPESLQTDPYGAGWLIKVELDKKVDVSTLLDAKTYEAFVSAQEG